MKKSRDTSPTILKIGCISKTTGQHSGLSVTVRYSCASNKGMFSFFYILLCICMVIRGTYPIPMTEYVSKTGFG